MKIMGLDPGVSKTGWVVIDAIDKDIDSSIMSKSYDIKYSRKVSVIDKGMIKTSSDDFMHIRLNKIYQEMVSVLKKYSPDLICIEITIVNVNPKTSIKLAEARGAIIAACGILNVSVVQIPPSVIKKTISGHGQCDKTRLGEMMEKRISNMPEKMNKDEMDALCCAYVGYSQKIVKNI